MKMSNVLRRPLIWAVVGVLVLAGGSVYLTQNNDKPAAVDQFKSGDDAGSGIATTTYDGTMVRLRTAIAIHPVEGADISLLKKQIRAASLAEREGVLTDASFAVFSEELLKYLVPSVTLVLSEGKTLIDAEYIMKNHKFTGLAFYLVESVVVHNLAFSVISKNVTSKEVNIRVANEGVLSDSLGRYSSDVQVSGVVYKYFGAIISDSQVHAVRDSIARAAEVDPSSVYVSPVIPTGPGVNMKEYIQQNNAGHKQHN